MLKAVALHEGVIRPRLVEELESFRAPDRLVSSYYLDLNPPRQGNGDALRIYLKDLLARERERIEQLAVPAEVRNALRRDWELVKDLAPAVIGQRSTLALACFVASESGYGRALRLPWPVRHRAFADEVGERVVAALGRARARGVHCRLIADAVGSRRFCRAVAPTLAKRGIEVVPALPVNKAMTVDEGFAMLGTANFDIRSFYLNFELNLLSYDADLNGLLSRSWRGSSRRGRRWMTRTSTATPPDTQTRRGCPLFSLSPRFGGRGGRG
jgi:hypothetical protein